MTGVEHKALNLAKFLRENCAPAEANRGHDPEWPVNIRCDEDYIPAFVICLNELEDSLVAAGYMERPPKIPKP